MYAGEEYRKRGLFWYVSVYLRYFMRPNADMKAAISRAKAELHWGSLPRPIIAMHVRGGDSCLEREQQRMARTCNSLADYMVHAMRAHQLYGAPGRKTTIFLATDTASVIADSKHDKWAKSFNFVHLSGVSREIAKDKIWDELIEEGAAMDFHHIARSVLLDMYLLAEGDVLIGKFTSNVLRTAYALAYANTGCIKPFVSLDGPWCFDYAVEFSGIGEGGRRFWC